MFKRKIFFLAVFSWTIYSALLSGMSNMLIPLFFLAVILIRDFRIIILLLLIVIRFFFIADIDDFNYNGNFKLSRIGKAYQLDINGHGKFVYIGKNLNEGYYKGDIYIQNFSYKRSIKNFSERDYYRSLNFKGKATIKNKVYLYKQSENIVKLIRNRLKRRTEKFGEYSELIYSLISGGKNIEKQQLDYLKKFSLLHLFVLSGLHIGIYYKFIHKLFKALRFPRFISEIVSYILLIIILFISDFHVSTIRAVIILIISSICFYKKTKIDIIEKVSIVTILIILINPFYTLSFSFILGTLAYTTLRISKRYSIISMFAVLIPIQLLFNTSFSPVYIIVNILLTYSIGFILPFIFLSIFFNIFAPLFIYFFDGVFNLLYFSDIISYSINITPIYNFSLILFYFQFIIRIFLKENESLYLISKNKYLNIILIIIFFVFIRFEQINFQRGVHFLDVSQGDSSIIITRNNKKILIDTGNRKKVLSLHNYLGAFHFDAVFLSHLDSDHSALINDISYDKLYLPLGESLPGSISLSKGDKIVIDDVIINVFHPINKNYKGRNESSLVFYLEAYSMRYLYTGDIDINGLENIFPLKTDVLKYPHHGSKHSLNKKFIFDINPLVTVLSYGNNYYGHPHKEVVEYLKNINTIILSTKEDGNIRIKYHKILRY